MRVTASRAPYSPTALLGIAQSGHLAAFLYVLGGAFMGLTAGALPPYPRERIWAGAVTAVVTGLVLFVLPWRRMPSWTALVPPLWAFVVLLVPIGLYGHALSHYLPLYTLLFSYVGLTLRRGTSLAMLPLGLVALLPAWQEQDHPPAAFLIGPVVVAALLGEVIGLLSEQHRRGRGSLNALLEATERLQSASTTEEAADVVAGLAADLLGADSVAVMLRSAAGSTLLVNANTEHSGAPTGGLVIDVAHGAIGCARALAQGEPLFISDTSKDPDLSVIMTTRFGHASVLFIPLGSDGAFEGVAVAQYRRRQRRIDDTGQRAAEVLAVQAGHVLRRVRETQALHDLATTDPLTGLPNRRVFFARLADLKRGDTIAFLDLDHFKALNDHEGHQHGDEVLRAFGTALRQEMREGDLCARYGGEEFALVLPATTPKGATELLERLRSRWSVERPGLTFSAGVAQHVSGPPTATLGAADGALFEAKAAGRNAVRVSRAASGESAPVTSLHEHRYRA